MVLFLEIPATTAEQYDAPKSLSSPVVIWPSIPTKGRLKTPAEILIMFQLSNQGGGVCWLMNPSMNMTPAPKLLANPPVPVLIGGMGDNAHHPDSKSLPHYTIESIRARAETVTPLLMAIPDYRPPLRWGINE